MRAYEPNFPFSQIRDEQHQAIEFAIDAFLNKKKKFVVLEMGPGCGKSATGITIARYLQHLHLGKDPRIALGKSYFLTTQKVLQEQYIRDFGQSGLKLIKSAGNYCCQFFDDMPEAVSCAEIQRLLSSKARVGMIYKMCDDKCRFKDAKEAFYDGDEGITNYAYFLTVSTYTNEYQRRGLLVLDEAHNVENAVSSFVKVGFSNLFYKSIGVKPPPVNAGQEVIYKWLTNVCRPKLREVIKQESKKVGKTEDSNEAIGAAKRMENLRRNFSRIEYFIKTYDPGVWVLDSSKTDKKGERIYEFKPIVVGDYCKTMLYQHCDRVLALSATILDKDVYCDSVGIDKNDIEFLRIPSPFPVANRPIHYLPVGSMSKACIDNTLPNMSQVVKMLLDQHPNDKGIIHCTNYRVSEYLIKSLGSKRLLTHNSDDREEVIKFHMSSPHPTVLLSPSMTEGVDLADAASRFQILCKVPFPYLGDAAVQRRMQRDPAWYNYQTVKSVVQAFGRSIRNETDYATSYILDADWERFYFKNKNMFPNEFSDALISP